jgi:hypothetical protein
MVHPPRSPYRQRPFCYPQRQWPIRVGRLPPGFSHIPHQTYGHPPTPWLPRQQGQEDPLRFFTGDPRRRWYQG